MDIKERAASCDPPVNQCKDSNFSPNIQENSQKNALDKLREQVEEVLAVGEPKRTKFLSINSASKWISYAKTLPPIRVIYEGMVVEGEINYFVASPGVGKTLQAYEVADVVSEEIRTLYIDAELSERQFEHRYPTRKFNDNLIRAQIDNTEGICMDLLKEVVSAAELNDAKFIIIDNIAALSNDTEKGSSASALMAEILAIKRTHPDWTLLVILHVPKMYADTEMSLSSVGGSAKLSQLCDNVTGFGQSKVEVNQFYAKTLKWRDDEKPFTEDNVLILERSKDSGGNVCITAIGYGREKDLLKVRSEDDEQQLANDIFDCLSEGLSFRQTAEKLKISLGKVQRVNKRKK